MRVDMIWAEGLPPGLEQRAQESIARNHAAVRAMDENPGCPVARASAYSAQLEGEAVRALLGEWSVEEIAA